MDDDQPLDAPSVIPEGQISRQRVEEGSPFDCLPPMRRQDYTTDWPINRVYMNARGERIGVATPSYFGGRFENFQPEADFIEYHDIESSTPFTKTRINDVVDE